MAQLRALSVRCAVVTTASRPILVLTGVLAAFSALSPSAHGLSVSVVPKAEITSCYKAECTLTRPYELRIDDAIGSDDDVVVRIDSVQRDRRITVTSRNSTPFAGAGCAADGVSAVRCSLAAPIAPGATVDPDVAVAAAVDLGAGDDKVNVSGVCGDYRGGLGNDSIESEGCRGVLWDGGPGADVASGRGVDISYRSRTRPVTVTAGDGMANDGEPGEGDDVRSGVSSIIGGSGGDVLDGGGTTERILGGPGDDELRGAPWINGNEGNDVITGGPGSDDLEGEAGDDVLRGLDGNDRIDGGSGHDQVYGGPGADDLRTRGSGTLDGGAGADSFTSLLPHGRQIYRGGAGHDSFTEYSSRQVRVSLDGRANDGSPGQHDNLIGIEEVEITRGTLIGSSRSDTLTVGFGTVDGRAGNDVIDGAGHLTGGSGRDEITARRWRAASTTIDARDGRADRIACQAPAGSVRVRRIDHDPQDKVVRCRVRRS